MNKQVFKNIKYYLKPSEALVQKTKSQIIQNHTTHVKHSNYYKVGAVFACLALVIAIGIPILNNINTDSNIQNDSIIVKNNNTEFNGLVLTAYTPCKSGQYLTKNYLEETKATVITPNVEILLASYSPAMSSVPGLPLKFDLESDKNSKTKVDKIVITIDNGDLLDWDSMTGIVTNNGKIYECDAGQTLYWSPLTKDKVVTEVKMKISTVKDDKIIATQNITISEKNYLYYATADEMIYL